MNEDLKTFALFTPRLGLKQDFPVILLPSAYFSDNQNIYIYNSEVHRINDLKDALLDDGGSKVATPDTFPIIHYHLYQKADGTEYLVVYTKKHVYYWNTATKAFSAALFTCASDVTHWSTVTFNDYLISTNDSDLVQKWDGTGSFADLDTASGLQFGTTSYVTKAKYVSAYENYLIFGWLTESVDDTPTEYPFKIRWSDLGNESDYDTGDAGANSIQLFDGITGFGEYKGFFFIFFENCIYRQWLTTDPVNIFNWLSVSKKIGCIAPDSIINGQDGALYFFASDYTFRHIVRGEISGNISPICQDIKPSLVEEIKAHFVKEYKQIWWSIPYGASATANNKIVAFDPKFDIWIKHNFALVAMGNYVTESEQKFLRDIGSDASGYTYFLHDDKEGTHTGYFTISTDLMEKKGITIDKRVLYLYLYFNNGTYLTGSSVDANSASGQKVLNVGATTNFTVGDKVIINRDGDREEVGDVASIQAGVSITLEENLTYTHTAVQNDDVEIIGKITAYIKCDNEKEWQDMGDMYLYNLDQDIAIKDLPIDYLGHTFEIKISGDNHFECLGLLFQSIPVEGRICR